jgi:aromatic ring-opening dioxygenase catalytic subunit (LigB family)
MPRSAWCFVLFVSFFVPLSLHCILPRIWQPYRIVTSTTPASHTMAETSSCMPVYFLGIGGPNFMEAKDHPAFFKLGETGREITTKVKPKAVVVFSAHWQHENSKVAVNVAENMDLIYDFYGFPPHYYEYKYPNSGSPAIAEKQRR